MGRRNPFRLLGMMAVVALFSISSVISYQQFSETSRAVSSAVKTGVWAAAELETELLKFDNTLMLTGFGQASKDDLVLRFELLWSRIRTLQAGRETEEVRLLPGAVPLLNRLHQLMSEIEPSVLALQPGDQATTLILVNQISPFKMQVRSFSVSSFVGSEARSKVLQSHEERDTLSISMFGLLGSGAALVLMLLRESARNRRQSLRDPLTGLANRNYFNEQLMAGEAYCFREDSQLGLLVIDLDNFKEVNDTLGHESGDLLLKTTSSRLLDCVNPEDTVARLGGDEFAIIHRCTEGAEDSARLARRICEQVGREIQLNGTLFYPAASIGVSHYPKDAGELQQVMINADIAMYRSKKDRGTSYRMYKPEMNAAIQRAKQLADDLRGALQNDELVLNYQPIFRFEDQLIESVEALLRWHHPEHGYIPPPEIVSVAEQSGLAKELNEWVIRQSCLQYHAWASESLPLVKVAVNISPAMYIQHDIVESLTRILAETKMVPEHLCIEVTEDTTMRDIDSSPDTMAKMKQLGVRIALDDFGTGYSSLSHLKCLPVDKLKIDRSFVQDLNNTPRDLRFIRSIISLAQSLEIDLVAEGIEFESNLQDLKAEGCTLGQGYLFSRAVSSQEITRMLLKQEASKQLPPEYII